MLYQNQTQTAEMDQASKSEPEKRAAFSDRFLTEVKYQQMLKPLLVLAALPPFVFFAIYQFVKGNLFPGTLFTLLTANAFISLVLGRYIKDIRKLTLLNLVGLSIAFTLLGFILAAGLLSDQIYLVIPWVATYPAAILLMMGKRIGIIGAVSYTVVMIGLLVIVHLPPWSDATQQNFKISLAFALIASLVYMLVAERSRIKTRNNLLKARNKYKASEERQRLTNEELKNEIQMRVQSEKALSQSELRYRALFEESSVSLWEENQSDIKKYLDNLPQEAMADLETYLNQNRNELKKYIGSVRITAVNRATLKLYDAPDMETLLRNIRKILPADIIGWSIERFTALFRDGNYQNQVETCTIGGRPLNTLSSSTVPAGYESSWEKVYTSVYDITERVAVEAEKRRVEEQLQHTRQFQAIASLAGGIAHQFNNALSAIVGCVDLLEIKTQGTPNTNNHFNMLRGSSERMRRLTEQLLAYAQGGKYQPTDFSVEELITNLLKSDDELKRFSGQIRTALEDDIVLSRCDLTQIQIVFESVLYNAVEAIQDSGYVIIASRKFHITMDHEAVTKGLTPGYYAQLTIADNGAGMDKETCRRIFEPFFTTKFVGRGLGMAAAYGIVRNHDGLIQVSSTLGEGTQVTIYLPCVVAD